MQNGNRFDWDLAKLGRQGWAIFVIAIVTGCISAFVWLRQRSALACESLIPLPTALQQPVRSDST